MDNGTEVKEAIKLQRATPAQCSELAGMYLHFEPKGVAFGLPPLGNPERWLDRLSAHPNFILMADDGRVVGHSVLCPETDSTEVVSCADAPKQRLLGTRIVTRSSRHIAGR